MIAMSHEGLRHKWHDYLANDDRLRAVATYARQRFDAEKRLTAHNWEHISRDTMNAIVIGEAEGADMSVVLPAIVMHDIGFLTGPTEGHGTRGADDLPAFLEKAGISYSPSEIAKQASCIRTHKGSAYGEHPDGLEAKVVADADLLEKFGAIGVYQSIRSFGEMGFPLAMMIVGDKKSQHRLDTETGRALAEPERQLGVEFFRELKKAAEPYGDSSL